MPYFSTYLGHISREETRCHISIRQMRDRMKKIRNPALFVPEPQCMRSSLLPFDDFCQCSWLIVHPRHHTADVDELPADMMSFRAGIANLFAPSKKESIFTGIMNMPMKHIAVFIIISPILSCSSPVSRTSQSKCLMLALFLFWIRPLMWLWIKLKRMCRVLKTVRVRETSAENQ